MCAFLKNLGAASGLHHFEKLKRLQPPMWAGFWALNSLNKGPFFGKFSINKGGLPRNWRKIAKMGGFPPKVIIKEGMTASFGN